MTAQGTGTLDREVNKYGKTLGHLLLPANGKQHLRKLVSDVETGVGQGTLVSVPSYLCAFHGLSLAGTSSLVVFPKPLEEVREGSLDPFV